MNLSDRTQAAVYAWREGDANMRAVWLCSRNDAIVNIAIVLAALVLGFMKVLLTLLWPGLADWPWWRHRWWYGRW